MCMIQESTGAPHYRNCWRGFSRKDQEKSRMCHRGRTARVQERESNRRRDVGLRPETDGREETGCIAQYGSGVRRHRETF